MNVQWDWNHKELNNDKMSGIIIELGVSDQCVLSVETHTRRSILLKGNV